MLHNDTAEKEIQAIKALLKKISQNKSYRGEVDSELIQELQVLKKTLTSSKAQCMLGMEYEKGTILDDSKEAIALYKKAKHKNKIAEQRFLIMKRFQDHINSDDEKKISCELSPTPSIEQSLQQWCQKNNVNRQNFQLDMTIEKEYHKVWTRIDKCSKSEKISWYQDKIEKQAQAKVTIDFPLVFESKSSTMANTSIYGAGDFDIDLRKSHQEIEYTKTMSCQWKMLDRFYKDVEARPEIFIHQQNRIDFFESDVVFELKQIAGEKLNVESVMEDIYETLAGNLLYRLEDNKILFKIQGELYYTYFDMINKKQFDLGPPTFKEPDVCLIM